ncbi:uncharacterized protein LOC6564719 [Drosophila grimshawi]|uniref:uncharacterized protein LOC6564719 n=1 Tax=Drosophila grimshawi TaxID=7222 RepID=UPI0013EF44C8|nr:uncharacterized protein LOC6564719 [Drosophila grimshawi]
MLGVLRIILCLQLLVVTLCMVDARWTVRPRRTTTTTVMPRRSTTATSDRHQHLHHWPPLVAPPAPQLQPTFKPESTDEIRLVDGFDQRSIDGQHEYRYQLSNGDTRYERTYWLPVGKKFVLARTGYYSVPLPGAQYSTTFYRADHLGYHVDTHTLSGEQPLLPRRLDLPHKVAGMKSTSAAKRNSISVPERNDLKPELHSDAQSEVKVQAVAVEANTLSQNLTKLSTVATLDDVFAAKLGTAATAVNDDNADDDADSNEPNVAKYQTAPLN